MPSRSLRARTQAHLAALPPRWHSARYYQEHRNWLRAKLNEGGILEPLEAAWLFEEADYLLAHLDEAQALLLEWATMADTQLRMIAGRLAENEQMLTTALERARERADGHGQNAAEPAGPPLISGGPEAAPGAAG